MVLLIGGVTDSAAQQPSSAEPVENAPTEVTQTQPELAKKRVESTPEQPEDLWERMRLDLSWQTVDRPRVDTARNALLKQSNYLPLASDRADYYLYYIVEEVEKRDMPMEIALIPFIESSLDPFASSPGGAAGLWQITSGTGKHLGLERSSSYDGRHALQDSTEGALDYLQSLYEEFDEDWLLAIAAYNTGPGNVARARQTNAAKGLGTDYWSLNLKGEANRYVPKVIALAQIVADPEQYDVDIPPVDNEPFFEVADTGRPLNLALAARMAGVDVQLLRALNPGLARDGISPNRPPELAVPADSLDRFEANIAKLSPEELVQWKTYRIKPGDNLGEIAEKFGTAVTALREANGIQDSNIQAGDTLKIPGPYDTDFSNILASDDNTSHGYRVRAGDSLYRIANKFNVSVSDIIAWNALDASAHLQPGQKLTLYPGGH